jgi:mannose-6-phosphate isomerase-like protein (cupin superfamily)
MMRQILAALFVLVVACDAGAAQGTDTTRDAGALRPSRRPGAPPVRTREQRRRIVDYIDAETLGQERRWLDGRRAIGASLVTSADQRTSFLLVRRATSSAPEVHARWDDLVIVRAGHGIIEMGDSLVGSRFLAPGERRGGKLVKPWRLVVGPGDVVRIPAVVPHTFIVPGKEPLEYLLIKQRRAELPVRWKQDE